MRVKSEPSVPRLSPGKPIGREAQEPPNATAAGRITRQVGFAGMYAHALATASACRAPRRRQRAARRRVMEAGIASADRPQYRPGLFGPRARRRDAIHQKLGVQT